MSNAKTNIGYKGNVKIKIGKNRFYGKNSGTPKLFEAICKYLTGGKGCLDLVPACLDIIETNKGTSILINPVNITTEYRSKGGPKAVVRGFITKSDLQSSAQSESEYELVLKSRAETYLAQISIDKDIIATVTSGRDALIEWELTFDNVEEGDTK